MVTFAFGIIHCSTVIKIFVCILFSPKLKDSKDRRNLKNVLCLYDLYSALLSLIPCQIIYRLKVNRIIFLLCCVRCMYVIRNAYELYWHYYIRCWFTRFENCMMKFEHNEFTYITDKKREK